MYNDCSIVDRAQSKRFLEELWYRNVANPLGYGLYPILDAISNVYDYPRNVGIIVSWVLELFTVFYTKGSELTLSPWATRQEEVELE